MKNTAKPTINVNTMMVLELMESPGARALQRVLQIVRERGGQVRKDPGADFAPRVRRALPVQPRARIPRAVRAAPGPAPIRISRQQDPGALAERGAQMRNARVD